jgi:hypothetical protein
MGRPPKPLDERRTDRLSGVRVTAAERVYIEAQAAAAELSVADYLRACALERRLTTRRASSDERMLREVNRIGTNLNQIAARVNFSGDLAEDFAATLAEIQSAAKRVSPDGS